MVTSKKGKIMDTQLTRSFLDACHLSKRIIGSLPQLPEWMAPRQVHVLDAIYQLSQRQSAVRPSDVARYLGGTMPSVTRMLGVLEKHGVIESFPDPKDKRSHTLVLTPYGRELYTIHVEEFHNHLADLFSEITENDVEVTIATISKAWELLQKDDYILSKGDFTKL